MSRVAGPIKTIGMTNQPPPLTNVASRQKIRVFLRPEKKGNK